MQALIDFASNNAILVSAFIIILALLVRTYIPTGAKSVTAMEAVRLINHQHALILDVRTQEEFSKAHIIDAVNIPLGLLSARLSEIQNHKSEPVILVCQSGNRSQQSIKTLKQNAFSQLYTLSGGMLSWQQANLPIESESKNKSSKEKKAQKKPRNISRGNNIQADKAQNINNDDVEEVKLRENIIVYTTTYCQYSNKVAKLLKDKGIDFQEVNVDNSPDIRQIINDKSQQDTFPQVFKGETRIGNCDELYQLDRDGKLDDILGLKPT